ncbi:hypothetical protein LCGC14_1816090 [marine sediment metagenome]|uniref:Uncharacterized protein n=1 Tax=marine sediment metagenome TaxID=412755 RepID=A0A0F9J055_9ZZZZ
MNYFQGIFVCAVTALIVTLLGQIPYQFNDKNKLRELNKEKKKIKGILKKDNVINNDELYEKNQKQLIRANWEVSRRIMFPLIIQMAIIFYALNRLRILNPMFLWLVWYIGFAMLFSRMWKKVFVLLVGG